MNREPERKELSAQEVPDPKIVYRWDYAEQLAQDRKAERKKARRGGVVFACVMATAFLLCLGMLAGVLVFGSKTSSPVVPTGTLSVGQVSDKVMPATVLIYTVSTDKTAYGTGFFVRSDGYIVTNYHIIKGAEYVSVTRYGSSTGSEAEVIGGSETDDIAVIKIKGKGYPTVAIGDSDAIHVGDVAIAIGNPGGRDASWTTTQGIVSAVTREVTIGDSTTALGEMHMIQTDAPVNPGNSGGPLCNDRGEVIGIVTRKLTDYEGIGFAIPINGAMKLVDSIIRTGGVGDAPSEISRMRPTIGITGSTIEKGDEFSNMMGDTYTSPADGVLVNSVTVGGAAAGKLSPGDVIVAIDGVTVPDMNVLIEKLYSYRVGDQITLTVYPLGETRTVEVRITLGTASE